MRVRGPSLRDPSEYLEACIHTRMCAFTQARPPLPAYISHQLIRYAYEASSPERRPPACHTLFDHKTKPRNDGARAVTSSGISARRAKGGRHSQRFSTLERDAFEIVMAWPRRRVCLPLEPASATLKCANGPRAPAAVDLKVTST